MLLDPLRTEHPVDSLHSPTNCSYPVLVVRLMLLLLVSIRDNCIQVNVDSLDMFNEYSNHGTSIERLLDVKMGHMIFVDDPFYCLLVKRKVKLIF